MPRATLVTAALTALLLTGCSAAPPAPPSPTPSAPAPATPTSQPSPTSAAPTPTPSPTPAATEPTQPEELTIDSVWNFRDVAGTAQGLPLADGGRMARGVVFRSGKLKGISAADRRSLVDAGITDIFDLRTDEVARRTPDPTIGDIAHHLVNIYAVRSYTDPEAANAEQAKVQREELYRKFVADRKQRARIGGLLKDIAQADGPVIIHCSEGKDRTGWVSAVLQLIAGVDEQTVMEEYLLSNERRADLVAKDVAKVRRSQGRTAAEIRQVRLEVYDRFLQAALDELTDRYQDVDGYVTDGLGLSPAVLDALRERLILR